MDSYNEYIVKKKKDIKDYLIWAAACIGAFLCCFIVLSIEIISTYIVILFWLVVGIIYAAYRVITSRNIEYEYAVTNGELDIDRITNKKRRKHILTIDTKAFEVFEPVSEDFINRIKQINPGLTIHAESDINSPKTYGAVFNKNGIKTCLYFQPSERILEAISRRRR